MRPASSHRFPFWGRAVLVALLALAFDQAHARVFSFKDERLASYFGGTFGSSSVGDSAYGSSSGTGVTVNRSTASNASGEIGLIFATPAVNLKLGAEYLLPRNYSDVVGSDASGTKLFDLNSKVYALIPMATVELLAFRTTTSHMIIGAGGGMAFVSLDNTYKMTSEGTTALGVGDFVESAAASVTALQFYTGYETLFADAVTVTLTLGYRHIPVPSLKSTRNTTAISGSQTESSDLKNMDGSNRSINLGGPFIGLSFRFYIGL